MMREGLDTWLCKTCFTSNKENKLYCQTCGKHRSKIKKVKRATGGYVRPPEEIHEIFEE